MKKIIIVNKKIPYIQHQPLRLFSVLVATMSSQLRLSSLATSETTVMCTPLFHKMEAPIQTRWSHDMNSSLRKGSRSSEELADGADRAPPCPRSTQLSRSRLYHTMMLYGDVLPAHAGLSTSLPKQAHHASLPAVGREQKGLSQRLSPISLHCNSRMDIQSRCTYCMLG